MLENCVSHTQKQIKNARPATLKRVMKKER